MARYVPATNMEQTVESSPEVQLAMRKLAGRLLEIAKDEAPDGPPRKYPPKKLKESGYIESVGDGFHVGFEAPHTAAVIFGTKPHRIDAKPGSVLHWKDKSGNDHFAKHVNHPGTKKNVDQIYPNDFLTKALDKFAAENRVR